LGERDENHAAIQRAYEALYCQVRDTHMVGAGFPDLIVSIPTVRGKILQLVEVKSRDGVLSPAQKVFQRDFGSVTVVRTEAEVFAHVERVREQFKR
jgi:hypothetical protein